MKLVCFVACAAAICAQAQTDIVGGRFYTSTNNLSLHDAIEMAVKHNYDVQIQRYLPLFDRYALEGDYGVYEPYLNAGASETFRRSPGAINSSGIQIPPNESRDRNYNIGIGGNNGGFAQTPWGLGYNISTTIDRNSITRFSTNGIDSISQYYQTFSGIRLDQPLLKNLWIDSTRQTILLAKKTLRFDQLGFRTQLINTIAQTEQAYYELNYSFENVRVQEMAVELGNRLVQENQKRVQVGAMAPLDEAQSESQLATSKSALVAARQTLNTQEDVLKGLITDDFRSMYRVLIKPTEKLVAVPPMVDLQDSWRNGVNLRPDLLQAQVDLERKGISVRYAYNQMFPQLDLVGSYGRTGLKSGLGDSFGDIADERFPSYSYGVVLSIPLTDRGARYIYRAAKAAQEQAKLQYRKIEQNVLVQIQDTIAAINGDYSQILATREARNYAELALQAEQKKLEVGKSTSFVVLQLQSNLTAARSAEIRALADYNKALAQLAQYEGTTLQKHNIEVKTP